MSHYESVHKQDVGWEQAAHIRRIFVHRGLSCVNLLQFWQKIETECIIFPPYSVISASTTSSYSLWGKKTQLILPYDCPLFHASDISQISSSHMNRDRFQQSTPHYKESSIDGQRGILINVTLVVNNLVIFLQPNKMRTWLFEARY